MDHKSGGNGHKPAPAARQVAVRPADRRGIVMTGRIVTLWVGQGHGYIRLPNHRDVFFHRADMREGTSINQLAVGDSVTFELVEDAISGARALRVESRRSHP